MTIATLWIDTTFEAAHSLPYVDPAHACHRTHGHSYRLRVWISGHVVHDEKGYPVERRGMVVDFDEIKRQLAEVVGQLDHRYLNEIIANPTAENVAAWLLQQLPNVGRVELRETHDCGVVMCREDLDGEF